MTVAAILAGVVAAAPLSPVPATLTDLALPDGWVHPGNYQFFDKDTLFGYINGESETFFPYGFRQLTVFEVYPEDAPDNAISLQIYQMGSPLDAFGIYSTYRQPDDNFQDIGNEAFLGDTQLVFYQDAFFVKAHFMRPEGDKADLLAVARAVSHVLPAVEGPPDLLKVLDLPGRIPRSEAYITRNVLGQDYFPRALQVSLKQNSPSDLLASDATVALTLVLCEDESSAKKALDTYVADLRQFGGEISEVPDGDGTVLVVREPTFERGLLAREGAHLLVFTTAPAPPTLPYAPLSALRDRLREDR